MKFARLVFALISICVAAHAQGNLAPSAPVDFGEVFIGTTEVRPVRWSNAGPGGSTLTGIAMGPGRPEFSFQAPVTFSGAAIPVGGLTETVHIAFTPTAEGALHSTVLPVAGPSVVAAAPLAGIGVFRRQQGDLVLQSGFVDHKAIDFGDIVVNTITYRTLTIRNNGPARTVIVQWGKGNQGFSVSMASGGPSVPTVSLPANDVLTVILGFRPFDIGTFTDSVTFADPAGGHFAGHVLQGKAHLPIGTPALAIGTTLFLRQGDANGNHTPETQVTANRGVGGERWRANLSPPMVEIIGVGATPAELAVLQAAYPAPAGGANGWVFRNGGPLPGHIEVRHYDAYLREMLGPASVKEAPVSSAGPDSDHVTFRYVPPGGGPSNPVAPNRLRWIQFICTNSPRPGAAFCPPTSSSYIDPIPSDDALPFYYTEPEHVTYSAPGDSAPLTLIDRPTRRLFPSRNNVYWEARLYLVEWNGVDPASGGGDGEIIIRNGVRWGFNLGCVAIGQPPDTFTHGGADRDKYPQESSGVPPQGAPSLECAYEIPTGVSILETDETSTSFSFADLFELRKDFFVPGSERFTGTVNFRSNPLKTHQGLPIGEANAVLSRDKSTQFGKGFNAKSRVTFNLLALSLLSSKPISVKVGNEYQQWSVRFELSSAIKSGARGTLSRDRSEGGAFVGDLTLYPKFTFVRDSDGLRRELDIGTLPVTPALNQALKISAETSWTFRCAPGTLVRPMMNDVFCLGGKQETTEITIFKGSYLQLAVKPVKELAP